MQNEGIFWMKNIRGLLQRLLLCFSALLSEKKNLVSVVNLKLSQLVPTVLVVDASTGRVQS